MTCSHLDLPALRVAGTVPQRVDKVAVCGGSGSELAGAAQAAGAQVYITGEVKHSTARWAEDVGLCIVDAGHFATENLIVETLVSNLHRELALQGINISVLATAEQKNPFSFFSAYKKETVNH